MALTTEYESEKKTIKKITQINDNSELFGTNIFCQALI